MKTLTTFLGTLFLFIASSNIDMNTINNNENITIDAAVFDGNEGNLYFFTDGDDKAITIEDDEKTLFKEYNSDANKYIGLTFEITIKDEKLKNNVCDSKSVVTIKLKETEE